MKDMVNAIVRAFARIAALERNVAGLMRPGSVHEVDAAKQRYRQKLGEGKDGKPYLSPWIPYSQPAGALKVHAPPSVGQQMMMIAPNGDFAQAFGMPMTFSDANASPSNSGDENVLTFGSIRITIEAGKIKIEAPEIEITGVSIKHNGKEIGSTHVHTGVRPGPSNTGPPA